MTAPAYRYAATCYKMIKEYSTALEYYQIVIDNWPDYRPAEHCQIMISKIYKDMRREGVISDYEAEIQLKKAYQNLIEKFPDSVQVGLALDRLEYYEKKDKKLTEAEKFQLISALSSKQAVNKTK